MRYFVTGGSGLIGGYVARQLTRQGHEVTVFDLAPDRDFLAELLGREQLAAVRILRGDVTDLPLVLRSMRESRAERVIHLAALLGKKSEENPLLSLRVNCEANINIFEASLACDVQRVVWASSVAVFGSRHKRPEKGAIANDAFHNPGMLYGACKSLTEQFSEHYRRLRRLNCVGLRFSLVYGYGKARTVARGTGGDFLQELIDKPAAGLAGKVPAGEAILDFLYAEDAADAVLAASASSGNQSTALNVIGFRASLREAADIVRKLIPDAQIEVETGSWKGTDHHYDGSVTKAEIGYAPQVTLEEGLRRNIAELRERAGPAG